MKVFQSFHYESFFHVLNILAVVKPSNLKGSLPPPITLLQLLLIKAVENKPPMILEASLLTSAVEQKYYDTHQCSI